MTQPYRLASGGRIERAKTAIFRFDGKSYQGHPGDTLASALLANGVRLVGRSFKYHRPRGFLTAGHDEPNGLVELRSGPRREPNTRATTVELYDGLEAVSQNRWPSLDFDLAAINGLAGRFLAAGFYYKTFMWPPKLWEKLYEPAIRRMAGLGRAPVGADPDRYERRHAHCDVMVIGSGAAGLAAARAAAEAGARVILAEQDFELGGGTLLEPEHEEWRRATLGVLAAMPEVRLLPRTTVFGYYDGNVLGAIERVTDHLPAPPGHLVRQRYWTIRAREVVIASGAAERIVAFPDNDRPGVMLASAAHSFISRWGAAPGRRAVLFTNNDEAYDAADAARAAGIDVAAIVDVRTQSVRAETWSKSNTQGAEVFTGSEVAGVTGSKQVEAVMVRQRDRGASRQVVCDLVMVSGGHNPAVHLASHTRARLAWDDRLHTYVPGEPIAHERSAGAARGVSGIRAAAEDGARAGRAAAESAGCRLAGAVPLPKGHDRIATPLEPIWEVRCEPKAFGWASKAFVDLQHDVTADDIRLAVREGYVDVQHAKRYTTHAMATDQGKTGGLTGVAILAEARGQPISEVGLPTFRPYVTPVAWGAIVGAETGHHAAPIRRSPLHDWHDRHGAVWQETGLWMRPLYYSPIREPGWEPILREARQVRRSVGLCDVSTLGKIDIQGADAARLLDRLYINTFSSLPVGRARYGIMLREDGFVFDDGTTTRIGPDHFIMTTTTAKAAEVMEHIEFCTQVIWPDLDVQATSITDQWCQMAVAGPRSRAVLERCVVGADVSNAALPFMGYATAEIAGVPVRIFRVSFSGELAYEVACPAGFGEAVWETILSAGGLDDIVPYGLEALNVLRVEKGHVTGAELNGQTTAADLGFERMQKKSGDFIGRTLSQRTGLAAPGRRTLVGIRMLTTDFSPRLRAGAHVVADHDGRDSLGWVSSVTRSCELDQWIGLAFVRNGIDRMGHRLFAHSPLHGECVEIEITSPHHVDPENVRVKS